MSCHPGGNCVFFSEGETRPNCILYLYIHIIYLMFQIQKNMCYLKSSGFVYYIILYYIILYYIIFIQYYTILIEK